MACFLSCFLLDTEAPTCSVKTGPSADISKKVLQDLRDFASMNLFRQLGYLVGRFLLVVVLLFSWLIQS